MVLSLIDIIIYKIVYKTSYKIMDSGSVPNLSRIFLSRKNIFNLIALPHGTK